MRASRAWFWSRGGSGVRAEEKAHLAVEEEHHAEKGLHQVVVGLRDGLRDGQQVVGQRRDDAHQRLRVQHTLAR